MGHRSQYLCTIQQIKETGLVVMAGSAYYKPGFISTCPQALAPVFIKNLYANPLTTPLFVSVLIFCSPPAPSPFAGAEQQLRNKLLPLSPLHPPLAVSFLSSCM
jgi:hypothetical protein